MTYAIFIRDVSAGMGVGRTGTRRKGYSRFCDDVNAQNQEEALRLAAKERNRLGLKLKVIALPKDRRDLWPDGRTGLLPASAD